MDTSKDFDLLSQDESWVKDQLREYLPLLDNLDEANIRDAAFKISGTLSALENNRQSNGEELGSNLLKIEHLGYDLEIPKDSVEDYNTKIGELKRLISNLIG